ncbi:MAG: hypothetical protein ACOCT0_04100 [Halobacteriota archaeon]
MAFSDWARVSARKVSRNGFEGVRDILHDLYAGVWWFAYPVTRGTNFYEHDWDVLVILDACRVDLLRSVADEYDFIGSPDDVDRVTSVGSMSKEWMAKTFTADYADEMAETAYVTANVFSDRMLDADDFQVLDEVWRYAWDERNDTVPPRPVTDRALRVARQHDPSRLIVHYVQPHHPFIELDGFEARPFGRDVPDTVVDALRKGKIDRERYMQAYRDNLRLALEDVEILLSNLDGDVAITADHGDALGEWGVYDHPVGFQHPSVKTVPWVETEADAEADYEPGRHREDEADDARVSERLQALGYVG